jgi:glycosyltransferase involved in cell wall biosynthesis
MNTAPLRLALLANAANVNVRRWCEGLQAAGAEIHLLSLAAPTEPLPHAVYRIPTPLAPGKAAYFAAVPAARRLLAAIQPDVVIAYFVTGYGTLGALAGRRPLALVSAGSDLFVGAANPLLRWLVRYNFGRADLVIALAPHMAAFIRSLGVPEGRLFTLPHGIPVEEFAGARCPPPAADDPLRLISTRSLAPKYRIDDLLRALHVLKSDKLPFSLTIVGDGPQREALLKLTKALGLENNARFTGAIPNTDLPALLAQHNLYISLTHWEGVSASLLEAMAAGLTPVVVDHPANRWWIEPGVNGALVGASTPEIVAQAIAGAWADLPLRERAWNLNLEIVRERADLDRNSPLYLERFRQLAAR